MEPRHLRTLIRWSWLLILLPIISVVVGYYYSTQLPTIYEAEATLIIGPGIDTPNPDLNALRAGEQLMQTYAELPGTLVFQEAVIEELNLSLSPNELSKLITIRPIVGTQLLRIIVTDEDAEQTIEIANTVAQNLVALGPSNDENEFIFTRIQQQADNLEEDIVTIEGRVETLSAQLEVEDDIVNQNLLTQQIADEETRLSIANSTLGNLYTVLQQPLINRISIIDEANEAIPVASQTLVTLIVALGAGLILSVVIGIGFIALEDDVFDAKDKSMIENIPIWGNLNVGKKRHKLVVVDEPDSELSGQYYQSSAQMLYHRDADNIQSLLFTSLSEPNYVPSIASNLATSIARTQNSVFLMDVNFRINSIAKIFNLPNATNLRELLVGEPDDINLADVDPFPHLKVLPSGEPINGEHSFDMLASPKMLQILRMFKQTSKNYRTLVITAPPLESMGDSLTLISQVDSVVFVVKNRSITVSELKAAVSRMKSLGGKVQGIIVFK